MDLKRHLFFDLDRTLWDFDSNSKETLASIVVEFKLEEHFGISFDPFYKYYEKINRSYWAKYAAGEIERESLRVDRFYNTLRSFGLENENLAKQISTYYLGECPKKKNLIPNALSVLDSLAKDFPLHIITNGFTATQKIKLKESGLQDYFQNMVTSDMANAQKPSSKIFEMAWNLAGSPDKENCFYIGDDWNADVRGAKQFGFTPIWFSTEYRKTRVKQVSDLNDIIPLVRE
ncbi:YjjG family noncanonical pyrimidine nucleotidase [Luteibaculum oceani]|uniref:YjjG family noncanonical pyrimidine nucleotidase n=1 Tax=Luteibaculum oceani TaxID=1294296 RepID=UPI00147698C4|nr:YjjG family noncanonical pyrimidine nucleotidase [Luteibaculum oceani]